MNDAREMITLECTLCSRRIRREAGMTSVMRCPSCRAVSWICVGTENGDRAFITMDMT